MAQTECGTYQVACRWPGVTLWTPLLLVWTWHTARWWLEMMVLVLCPLFWFCGNSNWINFNNRPQLLIMMELCLSIFQQISTSYKYATSILTTGSDSTCSSYLVLFIRLLLFGAWAVFSKGGRLLDRLQLLVKWHHKYREKGFFLAHLGNSCALCLFMCQIVLKMFHVDGYWCGTYQNF